MKTWIQVEINRMICGRGQGWHMGFLSCASSAWLGVLGQVGSRGECFDLTMSMVASEGCGGRSIKGLPPPLDPGTTSMGKWR